MSAKTNLRSETEGRTKPPAASKPEPGERILPRVTKGKRPYFFEDPAVDQLMTFFIELMTEVMVLRDRQDSLERMLDERGTISRGDLHHIMPSPEVEAERVAERAAFVERVLRIHEPDGRRDD